MVEYAADILKVDADCIDKEHMYGVYLSYAHLMQLEDDVLIKINTMLHEHKTLKVSGSAGLGYKKSKQALRIENPDSVEDEGHRKEIVNHINLNYNQHLSLLDKISGIGKKVRTRMYSTDSQTNIGFTPWGVDQSKWDFPYAPHVIVAKQGLKDTKDMNKDEKEGKETGVQDGQGEEGSTKEETKGETKSGGASSGGASSGAVGALHHLEGCVAGLTNQCFVTQFNHGSYFETTKLGVCDTLVTYDDDDIVEEGCNEEQVQENSTNVSSALSKNTSTVMLSWVKKKYEGAEEAGGRAHVYFDVLMTFYDKQNGGQHVTYKGQCTADGNKVAFDSEGGNSLQQLLSEQTFTIKKPTFHLVSENTLAKGRKCVVGGGGGGGGRCVASLFLTFFFFFFFFCQANMYSTIRHVLYVRRKKDMQLSMQ